MRVNRCRIHSFGFKSLLSILILTGVFAGCSSDEDEPASEPATATIDQATVEDPTATIETVYMSADLEEGIDRTETLVTKVDDIYIGTILSVEPAIARSERPGDVWTPYTVAVEQRLLGTVSGTITAMQQGGLDPVRNVMVILEERPSLEVGGTYLFASRSSNRNRPPDLVERHAIMPIYGHILIENEAQRQQLVQEFSEAIDQAGLGS